MARLGGRGGYRVGAGRPKGAKNRSKGPPQIGLPHVPGGRLPLAYMLAVMNDEQADPERRDKMAIAAASFCHPRAVAGKKTRAAEAAETAGEGTDWGNDLADTVN
jgi:hypothetical protein